MTSLVDQENVETDTGQATDVTGELASLAGALRAIPPAQSSPVRWRGAVIFGVVDGRVLGVHEHVFDAIVHRVVLLLSYVLAIHRLAVHLVVVHFLVLTIVLSFFLHKKLCQGVKTMTLWLLPESVQVW